MSIRTNNDCEGFHNRIRVMCHGNQQLYTLADFLYKESVLVAANITLVSLDKLTRVQKLPYLKNQISLSNLFQEYENNSIDALQYLFRGSYIIIY